MGKCFTKERYQGRLPIIAIEDAIKENSTVHLQALLASGYLTVDDLNRRNLLHQASWLGHPRCVRMLLEYGADPDVPHRKNGCTPLHLAHFCTVEETNPLQTIQALLTSGASVNNPGSSRCGKCPLDHAIQHQRLDSVQELIKAGSAITLQSVLITVDVANPQILELLLNNGGECGRLLEATKFWGQPLHRILYTPLKCPKECYKLMFKMLVQASVCRPVLHKSADSEPTREACNMYLFIEGDLRRLASDHHELTAYLFAYLVRNGMFPTPSLLEFAKNLDTGFEINLDWVDGYISTPASLVDLSVRVIRSSAYLYGNIIFGVYVLRVPTILKHLILLTDPC